MARICLVTPSHPTSNPRLLKEADALETAGHVVHVVAGRYFPPLDAFDAHLYAQARWGRTIVDYRSGPRVVLAKVRRRLARWWLERGASPLLPLALDAHHVAIRALASAAARVPTDLYIGHCLAGLAAAGLAAGRTGARLGFDAEDFHPAETTAAESDPVEIASIRRIESEFLPRCRHLTAASPLIGQAYADAYGLHTPLTVLNVFPRTAAPSAPVPAERPCGRPLLYWFSQTVGPGRGLEAFVELLGRGNVACTLRLRGLPADGFPEHLRTLARASGFRGSLDFAPIGPPDEMVRLAASADLGLSLEQTRPRNRDLCLTNKIFTYLLAGVPVALTSTSAQRALAADLGAAAVSLDLSSPDQRAAAQFREFLHDPARLAAARTAAWQLGATRYHWESEQAALLASVSDSLRP